jgi:uncharacterized membrane protein YkgB
MEFVEVSKNAPSERSCNGKNKIVTYPILNKIKYEAQSIAVSPMFDFMYQTKSNEQKAE